MRAFRPTGFSLPADFYARAVEARLAHSGEYVLHRPAGGDEQFVVMSYHFIPADESLSVDYAVNGTNPSLYGLIDHFEVKPENYDPDAIPPEGSPPSKGSQFVVRGLTYNVEKVEVNHRGHLKIQMQQADACAEPDPDFFEQVEELLCSPERDCDDT